MRDQRESSSIRIDAGPPPAERLSADVAVVGSGLAGLWTALTAAEAGGRVLLLTAGEMDAGSSFWAQGGIAAALGNDDSAALHAADTLAAGREACRTAAVQVLCEEIPDRVAELERLGVALDRDSGGRLALSREGGHGLRRVAHAGGSATGRVLVVALGERVAAHPRIRVLEHARATGLMRRDGRCIGVTGAGRGGRQVAVTARATVLATGGAAALWRRTTNPAGAVGAGLLLAHAAGAALADLEFVQFHPTALVAADGGDGFLLTEALRGEGALLLADGERFVDELAPRDHVALAIAGQLRERPGGSVMLDLRNIALTGFPNIAAALSAQGLHPERDPIPVAPAAHYAMGGIVSDLDGRATVPGLLAVGECACTGLHGANRLASNSLAECLVFGRRAGLAALDEPAPGMAGSLVATAAPPVASAATRNRLWRFAGVERERSELELLLDDPHPLARLIAASALAREETRGAHQRRDHPATRAALDRHHVVLSGVAAPVLEEWS